MLHTDGRQVLVEPRSISQNDITAASSGNGGDGSDEDPKERVDRELRELLEEVRVAIPGAEVLFAFLLGIAFTERFESVTTFQQNVYFGALLLTAAATCLLIAPTAYHRVNFRDGGKEKLLYSATRMVLVSLLLLLLAVSGVVFLVADLLYSSTLAGVAGGGAAGWFLWFWFGLPLARRLREPS